MSDLQYLRSVSLVVADSSGHGIDLSDLRVRFEVRRGDTQTPNSCDVRIYNLAEETAGRILNEFTQIVLQAGYGGDLNLIFRGVITQTRKGRLDQKDSYLDITAADGDEAYNYAPIALSVAAGSKPADEIQRLFQSMASPAMGSLGSAKQSITWGYKDPLPTNGRLRGRVYFGLARDALRSLARTYGLKWSIQDGRLVIIKDGNYIPGEPVLITPSTGLLGVPEVTQHGLSMRVLLNAQIRIGQLVKLDSSDINQFRYGLDTQSQAANYALSHQAAKLNSDGLYYVMRADHVGDTRGDEWCTELTCLSVDASVPRNITYGPSSSAIPTPVARY